MCAAFSFIGFILGLHLCGRCCSGKSAIGGKDFLGEMIVVCGSASGESEAGPSHMQSRGGKGGLSPEDCRPHASLLITLLRPVFLQCRTFGHLRDLWFFRVEDGPGEVQYGETPS